VKLARGRQKGEALLQWTRAEGEPSEVKKRKKRWLSTPKKDQVSLNTREELKDKAKKTKNKIPSCRYKRATYN